MNFLSNFFFQYVSITLFVSNLGSGMPLPGQLITLFIFGSLLSVCVHFEWQQYRFGPPLYFFLLFCFVDTCDDVAVVFVIGWSGNDDVLLVDDCLLVVISICDELVDGCNKSVVVLDKLVDGCSK